MKKVFAVALVFVLVLFFFTFRKAGQSDKSPPETAVHTERISETKVYSFSGSDDVLTVMNGTIILDEDEDIFSGGILKINSEEFFEGITSYTAIFYTLENDQRNTVMTNSVTDQTGGMVVFDGDDLGKISGPDIMEKVNPDNFIKNLYLEIKIADADGKNKTHQLHLDVTEVK